MRVIYALVLAVVTTAKVSLTQPPQPRAARVRVYPCGEAPSGVIPRGVGQERVAWADEPLVIKFDLNGVEMPDPQAGKSYGFLNYDKEGFCQRGMIRDDDIVIGKGEDQQIIRNPAVAGAIQSRQACEALCNYEKNCVYYSFKQNGNCTRFTSSAGECSEPELVPGHSIFRKNLNDEKEVEPHLFPKPKIQLGVIKYGGSPTSTKTTKVRYLNKESINVTCETDSDKPYPRAFNVNNRNISQCATICASRPGCGGFDWIPANIDALTGNCNFYNEMCRNATGRPNEIGQAFRMNRPLKQSISRKTMYSGDAFKYYANVQTVVVTPRTEHSCRPDTLACSLHAKVDLNKPDPTRAPTVKPEVTPAPTVTRRPTAQTPAPTVAPTSDGPYYSCSDFKIFSHDYDVIMTLRIKTRDPGEFHVARSVLRSRLLQAFAGTPDENKVSEVAIPPVEDSEDRKKGGSYSFKFTIVDTTASNSEKVAQLISKDREKLTNNLGVNVVDVSFSQPNAPVQSGAQMASAAGMVLAILLLFV